MIESKTDLSGMSFQGLETCIALLEAYVNRLEADLEHARAVLRGRRAALRNIEGKKGVEE